MDPAEPQIGQLIKCCCSSVWLIINEKLDPSMRSYKKGVGCRQGPKGTTTVLGSVKNYTRLQYKQP